MSRLIIKNLPPYITPPLLKHHLSQKDGPGGTLTDVQVAQTPDGRSRRFAFVGYKTEEEASRAQAWFDRSYVGMTRIGVEVVEKGAKDAPRPRPNKKPRIDIENNNLSTSNLPEAELRKNSKPAIQKNKGATTTTATGDNDTSSTEAKGKKSKKETELGEFMQVMQPRTKKERTWANDDSPIAGPSSRPLDRMTSSSSKANKANEIENEDTNGAGEDELEEDGGGVEEVDDMEWMRRKMKKDLGEESEERVFMQDDEGLPSPQDAQLSKSNAEKAPEETDSEPSPTNTILQTGRLFLRNLSYTCTQSDLEGHFSKFGAITQVHIPLDPISKSPKGLAFVTFEDPKCAVKAFEELDKTSFQGRLLHILPAAERISSSSVKLVEDKLGGTGKTSVKKEKEKKRKEGAAKEFNWSMLYMNADAVASSIADRMNIPKADILNPDSENGGDTTSAAVKLALAETHIIQETKAFLESEGIDLSAFSTLSPNSNSNSSNRAVRAKRSDTVILVKNIPYGTTSQQIRELFEPHGELRRVVVPPSGTIAVVEFAHPDDAGRGFRGVAYRRMGGSVVYLEKAPVGVFNGSQSSSDKDAPTSVTTPSGNPTPGGAQDAEMKESKDETKPDQEEEETPPGSTLFLKNLAFATTSARLTSVLRHLPGFSFARVQTKPDPKRPSIPGQPPPRLSMGFGFVGFTSKDAAKTALRSIQGLVVDGHALSVKFAGRGAEEDQDHNQNNFSSSSSSAKATSKTTKMIVKNLPFEATKSDLRALFNTHGTLKSVRLPKKFNSHSRGYAFLEFATRLEAERVFGAMMHTHLLGRHLVLEWAEDGGGDVEGLRRKAGVGFGDGSEMPGRKRKLEFGGEGDDVLDE